MIRPALSPAPVRGRRSAFSRHAGLMMTAALLAACGEASQPDTTMNAGDIPENQGTRRGGNDNAGIGGPAVRQSPEPTGNPAGAQGYPATGRP